MSAALVMFGVFVAIALVITYWAAGRSTSSRGFYAAHRQISGVQNGWAIAGDYMSAASFLGFAGLIAFYGFDGFFYAVGWLVGYLVVLFLIAEPLRNTGRYTVADVIGFRLGGNGVRAIAALTTLAITLFYMVAQMVGAGSIINLLVQRIDEQIAIVLAGLVMMVYVLFGGMLSTTWVQIIKAGLLFVAAFALTFLVFLHFGFSVTQFLTAATAAPSLSGAPFNLFVPGHFFSGPSAPFDLISLALALAFGTAGLPHVLMRFFTVPSAKAARTSVGWAMILVGVFYLLTSVIGFGAATIVGQTHIGKHIVDAQAIRYIARNQQQADARNAELSKYGYIVTRQDSNVAAPVLAEDIGGPLLFAFVAAAAFATILAVMAGLTIAASSAFAHDIWYTLVRKKEGSEQEHVLVARTTAVAVAALAIFLSIKLRGVNVAFLIGLAFAVAASANVPALILSLTWKRFTRAAAITSMLTGLISSLALIALSPSVMHERALFPLNNPAIVSLPLSVLAAILVTFATRDKPSEDMFNQLRVRSNTGLGAEV